MSIQELDDVLKSHLLADTSRGLNEAAVQETVAFMVVIAIAYGNPPERRPSSPGEMAGSDELASPSGGRTGGASP